MISAFVFHFRALQVIFIMYDIISLTPKIFRSFPRSHRVVDFVTRLCAFSLLTVAVVCYGQGAGSTLTGTVTDPSGASVVSAQLVITQSSTDVTRELTTNASGFYTASNLAPGGYEVTVTAAGFATMVQHAITLNVGDVHKLDFHLTLAAENQTVNIMAEQASGVDLASSQLKATVTGKTVRDLPLNGRDWTQLGTLEPGVQVVRSLAASSISNTRGNRGLGTQMTIGGQRPQQNNYRLDGVSINDYSNGAPGSVLGVNLGVDSVGEFSVVTGTPPAEYGKSSAGVINAITRSGSNQFHGTVYEFLRNSAVDARNYFDPVTGKPPFRRNQFGAAAGGPLQHDKMFVFGDYEGLRQSLNNPVVNTVFSRAARSGTVVCSPPGIGTCPSSGTKTVTINAQVAPYLAFYPLPNGLETGDQGIYSYSAKQVTTENFVTTRLDRTFRESDSAHATYLWDSGQTTAPDLFNNVELSLLSGRQLVTLEETHIFSPRLANVARFGFSRNVSEAPRTLSALNAAASDPAFGFVPTFPVGSITVTGITNFTGGIHSVGEYDFHFNSLQESDDVSLALGRHALKFGFALERLQANQLGNVNPNGQFSFSSVTNFLTNAPQTFNAPLAGAITPRDLRQWILGVYAQDDWRATTRLTLNLGLRYEPSSVPTEVHNELASLPTLTSPTPHLGSPYFSNPTFHNFSPRLGFAYDIFGSGKTALRGAFGIYDVLPQTYEFELLSIGSAPFYQTGTLTGAQLAGTFPKAAYPLLSAASLLSYSYVQQNPKRDYVMQWNLNVQQAVGTTTTVEVGYAGSGGVHQPLHLSDTNQVQPISLTPQGYLWPASGGVKINPSVGSINSLFWNVSAHYHAGHIRVSRNLSHGWQAQGSYTYAKSIDSGSATVAGGAFTNSIDYLPLASPTLRRGLSDFDVRNNFVFNAIWQIPAPKKGFAKVVLGGWQLNSIFQASGGLPFTPSVGGDPLGLNSSSAFDFPNHSGLAGCSHPVNPGNPVHYIRTECFLPPSQPNLIGNSRRNDAIGPGLLELDPSAFKNFTEIAHMPKNFNMQFRAEFFNAINHSNFSTPTLASAQLYNGSLVQIGTAGKLASTSTTSRQIQFSLRASW
jgi:hypothetical protein